jgi:hypothetical protein
MINSGARARLLALAIAASVAATIMAGCGHSDDLQKPTSLAQQTAALRTNPPPSYVAAYFARHHMATPSEAGFQTQQAAAGAAYTAAKAKTSQ